ncbi:MAG: ankyrin repeat domain-containing protein [Candidatus Latescibacteria bacterium]|nr:ankyrin repeat domain-containing protein [Candidatus Latescibacterota bacterium]
MPILALLSLLAALCSSCGPDPRADLEQAARQGDLAGVRAAIAAGAQPTMQLEDNGRQAIHLAAWKGHLDIVKALVEEYSASLDERAVIKPGRIGRVAVPIDSTTRKPLPGPEGTLMTPLMETVSESQLEVARYLLAKGADVHAQDRYGNSSLMLTTFSQNTAMADLLLSYGASVSGICGF